MTAGPRSRKEQVLELIREKRLREAQELCSEIAHNENLPGAWSLLGVISGMQGDEAGAETSFRRALTLNPDDVASRYHLGLIHENRGQRAEATDNFRAVVRINPEHTEAMLRLGHLLTLDDRHQEAAVLFSKAANLMPENAEVHYYLGNALRSLNQPEGAISSYRRALMLNPSLAQAHCNLGLVLAEQGNLEEAAACYRTALSITPSDPLSHNNLGRVLFRLGQRSDAIAHYRHATTLRPDFAEAHNNLGVALSLDPSQRTEALVHYRRAIAIQPDYAEAYNNLAVDIAVESLEDAVNYYRKALTIKPDFADAHFNMSLQQLLMGDFDNGWEGYEWRWRCEAAPKSRIFHQPTWDGAELHGRTILLYAEQGFGDTLQFIRYAPLVQKRGGRVLLECQPPLVRLLRTAGGIDQILPAGSSLPAFDLQLSLLSLPRVFHTRVDNIPANAPYLSFPDGSHQAIDETLARYPKHPRIGIVWQGSETHRNDVYRSCPLSLFVDLAEKTGLTLFSLQKGPRSLAAATNVPKDFPIVDLSRHIDDFYDTAAAIKRLDLVICVDTSVAHLAGALGRATWVLLPYLPDWRWLLGREDSPWYRNIRLFRQTHHGDWNGVFARVADALTILQTEKQVHVP